MVGNIKYVLQKTETRHKGTSLISAAWMAEKGGLKFNPRVGSMGYSSKNGKMKILIFLTLPIIFA